MTDDWKVPFSEKCTECGEKKLRALTNGEANETIVVAGITGIVFEILLLAIILPQHKMEFDLDTFMIGWQITAAGFVIFAMMLFLYPFARNATRKSES